MRTRGNAPSVIFGRMRPRRHLPRFAGKEEGFWKPFLPRSRGRWLGRRQAGPDGRGAPDAAGTEYKPL